MCNRILSAETILPIVSAPLYDSSVAISGNEVIDLGNKDDIRQKYKDFTEVHLGKGILLPGFINGHVHLELGWMQGKIGEFEDFTQWLTSIINLKANDKVTDELIKRSIKDGLLTLIRTGVSTVGEISSYDGLDKNIIYSSGIRAIIFEELFDRHIDIVDDRKYEKEGLIETRPFPHAPYSCSPELLKKIFSLAYKSGVSVGIHLAESEEESLFVRNETNKIEERIYTLINKERYERPFAKNPLDYIKKYNDEFQTKLTIVHATHLSDEEVDELKEKNVGIIVCPRSNHNLKVGTPPLDKLTELERLGLATDGLSSNHNLDYFEEMRTLYELLSYLNSNCSSFQTIYLATLGGARSLFIEDRVGSIEAGKKADLIFISYSEKPDDPYLYIIYADKDKLKMNMVNGQIIYSSAGAGMHNIATLRV